MAFGLVVMGDAVESRYVQDGRRMEVGHRLEVAGAVMVWRRKSAYLAEESGKVHGGAACMLGVWGLLQGEGAEAWSPENWPAPSSLIWMEHGAHARTF